MSKPVVWWVLATLLLPGRVWAGEAAPALADREIVERLTRLEEGQSAIRSELGQLRADMHRQNQQLREDMGRLRADMNQQNQQLRADMDRQFARQFRLTLALLGAFSALVAAIIGFALWGRRTMLRPVERTLTTLTAELSTNRQRLEALRSLGQRNPEVASVPRQFNLL